MKTEETNKIIAEFLGWKNHLKNGSTTKVFLNNKEYIQDWEYINEEKELLITPIEMKFHNDWNWLMEVVEKIESLDGNIHICNNDVFVHFPKRCRKLIRVNGERLKINRIEAVYNACVTFIEWYNKQTAEEN